MSLQYNTFRSQRKFKHPTGMRVSAPHHARQRSSTQRWLRVLSLPYGLGEALSHLSSGVRLRKPVWLGAIRTPLDRCDHLRQAVREGEDMKPPTPNPHQPPKDLTLLVVCRAASASCLHSRAVQGAETTLRRVVRPAGRSNNAVSPVRHDDPWSVLAARRLGEGPRRDRAG